MNRYLVLFFLIFSCLTVVTAQDTTTAQRDSVPRRDTISHGDTLPRRDTVAVAVQTDSTRKTVTETIRVDHKTTPYRKVLLENPWFNFSGKAVIRTIEPRVNEGKDGVFYLLLVLFFLLALIRAMFGRYLNNLFTVFFRASMKQKQIREQLLQAPLASILLNLLFIGAGGLLLAFTLKGRVTTGTETLNFWWLYIYSIAGLAFLYLGKYFLLKLIGWTLRMEETTDTYIFIVFMCNKVLAIMLLPLLLLVAFGSSDLATVAITLCYVLVIGIMAYRYISSYGYINREVRTSRFHFFLYLCAFEVAPLLLIYKVLLKFV